jgi:hypothetical protein
MEHMRAEERGTGAHLGAPESALKTIRKLQLPQRKYKFAGFFATTWHTRTAGQ